jgi:hypothetical protein
MVIFPCLVQSMDGQTHAKYVNAQSTDLNGTMAELTTRFSEMGAMGEIMITPEMFKLSFTVPLAHGDADSVVPRSYNNLNKSKVISGH